MGSRLTASRVHLDPRRWADASVYDRPRWTRPATDHARGQQPDSGVVELGEVNSEEEEDMGDMRHTTIVVAVTLAVAATAACGKKKVATGPQPAPVEEPATVTPNPPAPTERVEDRTPVTQPLA